MGKTSTYSVGQSCIQPTQTCKIRFATYNDLTAITGFIITLCKSLKLDYELDTIHNTVFLGIDKGIGLVAEIDNKVVGCLAVLIYPSLVNKNLEAQELLWYVLPKYRKLKVGIELYQSLEEVCKRRNIKRLFMMAPRNKSKSFECYYNKNKFTKIETSFVKEL